MEATIPTTGATQAQEQTTKQYKSPPHALIWFFRKSRDLWKGKYQALHGTLKSFRNRVTELTKSRDQWKLKAEQANAQLAALKVDHERLSAQGAPLAEKKTTRTPIGTRSTQRSNT